MPSPNPPVDGAAPAEVNERLTAGRAVLVRGAWEVAHQAYDAELKLEERPAGLEGLGFAAWRVDIADGVFEAPERDYRGEREGCDSLGAARMAVSLSCFTSAFRGDPADLNGCLPRARRLHAGLPD